MSTVHDSTPRIVELVRVSTVGQAERDTPELQRQALDAMRAHRPGLLVERLDSAVSGNAPLGDRADLRRLAALADARAFDELRVYKIDRLTRSEDLGDRVEPFRLAKRAGAVIVDCAGKVIDPKAPGGQGELIYQLDTWMAAQERERIRDRTLAGRRRMAAAGRLASGRPPFGLAYSKRDGWSLHPERAPTVRRIFDLYLAGQGVKQIAALLNAEGVPTSRSAKWSSGSVYKILRGTAAIGEWRCQGSAIKVPAMVDAATFAAVQERLAANRSRGGPAPSYPALFRRALRCGDCGRSLRITSFKNKTSRAGYYVCTVSTDDTATHRHYAWCHRVEPFDAAVRGELERVPSDRKLLAAVAEELNVPPTVKDSTADLAALKAEAKKLEVAEARVLDLLGEDGISTDTVKARLKELAAKRAAAVERVATLEREQVEQSRQVVALKDIRDGAALALKAIKTLDPKRWVEVIRVLFPDRLKVFEDHVEAECVLPLAGLVNASGSTGTTAVQGG